MLKIAYAPIYKYELPERHRFPMVKYELLPEQLVYEGTVTEENFFHPEALDEAVILRTHDRAYWEKLKAQQLTRKEIRAIGFPLSERLVHRGRFIARGTIDCALFALECGVSMNIAGGTHHAYRDRGEGFCLLNDFAIASNYLLVQDICQKVLIVDLDVHQGNGTAHIFEDEPRVFTFSMHGERNYPLRKERSDLDIGLPDKTGDTYYLKVLEENLPRLLDEVQPNLIFYLSGVDVLETDKLGRLALTKAGCRERDRFVFSLCKKNDIPVAVSMGGGYNQQLAELIDAHANTYRVAQELFF